MFGLQWPGIPPQVDLTAACTLSITILDSIY
jgi:hypothetical protein